MPGDLLDGWRLEDAGDFDRYGHELVQAYEDARSLKRVPAQGEEIIMDTDLFEFQHLCPDSGQHLLERRPWCHEGRPENSARCEAQLGRQPYTLHFAGRTFRDFTDDEYLARDLEIGDASAGELTNVFRRSRGVGPQHDRRGDILAEPSMGDGEGDGLGHCWMVQQHFVDFLWSDLLPAAIDHLAYAAREKQITVVVEITEISCLEPIADKRRVGCPRVAIIACHNGCTLHDDLTGLAVGQQSSSFVHDRDIQDRWQPDRTRLALAWRQRIARDRRGSDFRHPVPLDHRALESSLELGGDARRQGGRRGANEPQPAICQSLAIVPSLGKNRLVDRWHRGVPRRLKLG